MESLKFHDKKTSGFLVHEIQGVYYYAKELIYFK